MLNETNIVSSWDDCDACNATCYKLIDCGGPGNYPTVATADSSFAVYVGKTVKWTDVEDIEHCATVYSFICRTELFIESVINIVDCFDTCAACLFVEPDAVVPELKIGRAVQPGYDVPDCAPPKTTSCE